MSPIQVKKTATYSGHRDCIYALAPGPTPEVFYTAGGDGLVVQWDTRKPDEGELMAKVEHSVYAIATDLAKNRMYVGHNYNGIHIIDIAQKKEIASTAITSAPIYSLLVHHNQLWIGAGDGTVYIMDTEDFSTRAKIKISQQNIRHLTKVPFGSHIIASSSDTHIYTIDATTFQVVAKPIAAHSNSVFAVAFADSGNVLVSGGRDAHLKKWSFPFWDLQVDIPAHLYAINDIQLSPSGKYLATASMDKSIKLWDSVSLQLLKVIDKSRHAGHGTSVNKILWMGSDESLVSVSDDRTVSLWHIQFSN